MEVAGVPVHPVESHHWSFAVTPSGELLSGPAMGFMIDAAPGVRLYHQGDSALTYDFRLCGELYRPTHGLMVVALPEDSLPHFEVYRGGEVNVQEAVMASQWLGLKHVIASHYQWPSHPDVQALPGAHGGTHRGRRVAARPWSRRSPARPSSSQP